MRRLGSRLVPRSLRVRIMITLVGLVVTLGVVALVRAATDMVALLEDELEQRGVAIAAEVAARSVGPALTNDVFGLYEIVNGTLITNPDVRYVFLLEPSGDIRVHTFADVVPLSVVSANSIGEQAGRNVRVLNTSEGPIIDVAFPVFGGEGGTVRVGMSEAGLRDVVIGRVGTLALLVVVGFVAAVGASFVLASVLTRPLARFAEAARNVGRGELTGKLPVETADELGDLAVAFNSMTDALAESRDGLMRRNEELRILNEMADHLSRQSSGSDLAKTSLRRLLELTDLPAGWICIRDQHGLLRLDAHHGVEPGQAAPWAISEDACGCREVLHGGGPILLGGQPACPLLGSAAFGEDSGHVRAVLPLFSREAVIGVLAVRSDSDLGAGRMALLTSVGQQIGIAMENARLYREVQAKEEARGQLLSKLIFAQEEERKRVAREIHDEPTQALTGIVMRLDNLQRRLPGEQAAERREVDAAKQSVRGAIGALHRIMLELRPSALDDLGLVPAIRGYAEQRLAEAGMLLDFHADPGLRLDPEVEVAIFRLVQEAVNNVYKHSGASRVKIWLELDGATLSGSVEDDGRGFDARMLETNARGTQGLGLAGMEERARLLGGRFSISSAADTGTTVMFDIPVQAEVMSHGGEATGTRS